MTSEPEIQAALQAAFAQCNAASCSLTQQQQEILLQVVIEELIGRQGADFAEGENANYANPLDELTSEECQALLQFVKEQEQQNRPWKVKLLNDWLHDRSSGGVQFIRDRYGPQWLNRIKRSHLAKYFEQENNETLKLKPGDRIEVSNSLWEWVQPETLCTQQWFACTVLRVYETKNNFAAEEVLGEASAENTRSLSSCLIRFDNGMEFEIQGVYDWNRYNWRWLV